MILPQVVSTSQRWKVYALGGGLGHLNRALSVSRAATSRGHRVDILVNSRLAPSIPWNEEIGPDSKLSMVSPSASPSETSQAVSKWLQNGRFDRLVVDTFPRGLAGELPAYLNSIDIPKVLVHRKLNHEYVIKCDLASAVRRFDLILVPGEKAPFASEKNARVTQPWLIRDSAELLTPCRSRIELGVEAGDHRPILVVCTTGQEREKRFFMDLAASLEALLPQWIVRTACIGSKSRGFSTWPLIRLLPGVSGLVGGGGYNLVNEARATNTPLLAFALPRRYDRQANRLCRNERVRHLDEVVERIVVRDKVLCMPSYSNGVHDAVDLIERAQSSD